MNNLLAPISQMTRGQQVFGACIIAHGLYSAIEAGVNAYNSSDRDLRIKYIALTCLKALNTAFKSIAFVGYATGNVHLMAIGGSLTALFMYLISQVEIKIEIINNPKIISGRAIYNDIFNNMKEKENIFNKDNLLIDFLIFLDVTHHITISTESKDSLEKLFIKHQTAINSVDPDRIIPLTSRSWNDLFLSFYNDIKALENQFPLEETA